MAYVCDSCGQDRKGQPHVTGPEGLGFCFLCAKETERHALKWEGEQRDREMAAIDAEFGQYEPNR